MVSEDGFSTIVSTKKALQKGITFMRSRQRITQFYWRKEIKMPYFVKWYQVLKLGNQCQPWLLHQIRPCLNQKTTKNIGGSISPEWAQNAVRLLPAVFSSSQPANCLIPKLWPFVLEGDLPGIMESGQGFWDQIWTSMVTVDMIQRFRWGLVEVIIRGIQQAV